MDNQREETYRKMVEAVAPSDPFLILEHGRGIRWEVIWNTYLAEEFEGRLEPVFTLTLCLKGVPQG